VVDAIREKVMVPKNHNDQQPEQQPQQQQALQTPESGVRRSTRISSPLNDTFLHYIMYC